MSFADFIITDPVGKTTGRILGTCDRESGGRSEGNEGRVRVRVRVKEGEVKVKGERGRRRTGKQAGRQAERQGGRVSQEAGR